ncbi:MAG: DUF4870 family protein [Caulobacterales bacterium]|jgi:uncharacterized membrane protein
MTDYRQTDYRDYGANEDRTLPAVCYALYLVGLTHGLTIIIGLIIAYASRGGAGPAMRSHYTWLIRTFWLSIVLFLIGAALIFWGGIFSIILVGLPFFALGWIICGGTWLWVLIRCVVGVIAVARDEPVANPYSWLL